MSEHRSVWVIDHHYKDDNQGKLRGLLIAEKINRVLAQEVVPNRALGEELGFDRDEEKLLPWVCYKDQVYEDPEGDFFDVPDTAVLFFLHIGQYESDYGNRRSVEFYRERLARCRKQGNRKLYVVGYTGGEKKRPKEFDKSNDNLYLTRINAEEDLNFAEFFALWARSGVPELSILERWPTLPIAFKILKTGFDISHGTIGLPEGLDEQMKEARKHEKATQGREWWKPVFGDHCNGDRSKEELGARIRAWRNKRSHLNHDWLQVDYLTFTRAWRGEITTMGHGGPFSEGIKEQVLGWRDKAAEWREFIVDAEEALSPRQLLSGPPLEEMPDEQKGWLGDMLHEVYCAKTGIRERVDQLINRLEEINGLVDELTAGIAGADGGKRLYGACMEFSSMVSALPSRIQL
jgi:hypothetical protein